MSKHTEALVELSEQDLAIVAGGDEDEGGECTFWANWSNPGYNESMSCAEQEWYASIKGFLP